MKIIMMGTGPFAIPSFRLLCSNPHVQMSLLISQPPRGIKNRPAIASPMVLVAEELGIPVWTPERINDNVDQLRSYEADIFVVCDYGQILSPEVLASSTYGGVNLHGSLLPKYRGAAPVNKAIWEGDTTTGVTIIHLTPELDAGPIVARKETPIEPDETATQLEARLSQLGAPLVVQVLEQLFDGHFPNEIQVEGQATKVRRLKKDDGRINWTQTAFEIRCQVRALEPWPQTFFFWTRNSQQIRIIPRCIPVIVPDLSGENIPSPGTIVEVSDRLIVQTGSGKLVFTQIQPAGKKVMDVAAFARGYGLKAGETLE